MGEGGEGDRKGERNKNIMISSPLLGFLISTSHYNAQQPCVFLIFLNKVLLYSSK